MFFFFQAEDGIRDLIVTGVQTCALPISAITELMTRMRWKPAGNVSACSTGTWTGDIERRLERVPPFVKSGMTNPEAFSLHGAAWWSPGRQYEKPKYPGLVRDRPLHLGMKGGRIGQGDGSFIRLRAERPNHVWSYDFVEDRTHEGRKYRMLNVLDEFTLECLAIRVDRKLKSTDVIDVLSDLFILRDVPEHVRSDNGPEFVAKAVQDWIAAVGAKTAYIEPGSP